MKKNRSVANIISIMLLVIACDNGDHNSASKQMSFDTAFSAALWRKGSVYTRGRMVKNLIESNALKSISKDSLVSLLGPPNESGNEFCNYLVTGKDTSIKMNYLLFHIQMDSIRSIVTDYWITD